MDNGILKIGEKIKPELPISEIKALIENNYNLKIENFEEMKSFDDRNYLITADCNSIDSKLTSSHKSNLFTFKVTNTLDSSISGLIEAIDDISLHVHKSNIIQVPCPLPDKNNNLVTRIDNKQKTKYAIRLMTFIPGIILCDTILTSKLLYEAGVMVAKMTKCLETFSNKVLEHRITHWSLYQAPKMKPLLYAVNKENRKMIEDIFDNLEKVLSSKLKNMKKQVIHGDVNEQNIVLDSKDDETKIIGLLDFSDAHYAPTIFDLAIFCCYMTIIDLTEIDPLIIPGIAIAGYSSVIEITEEEWSILPTLIMGRLAQSLTLGAYSYSLHPNNFYLLTTAKNGWKIIKRFYNSNVDELIKQWKNVNKASIINLSKSNQKTNNDQLR